MTTEQIALRRIIELTGADTSGGWAGVNLAAEAVQEVERMRAEGDVADEGFCAMEDAMRRAIIELHGTTAEGGDAHHILQFALDAVVDASWRSARVVQREPGEGR